MKYKKLLLYSGLVAFIVVAGYYVALAASGQVTFTLRAGEAVTKTSKAYADSQVDTLRIAREPGLQTLGLAIHWKDSVSVTTALIRRVTDGKATGIFSASPNDSLFQTPATIVARGDTTVVRPITLAPLADEYWVIITYAGSANGVTTPTAVYSVQRQYAK